MSNHHTIQDSKSTNKIISIAVALSRYMCRLKFQLGLMITPMVLNISKLKEIMADVTSVIGNLLFPSLCNFFVAIYNKIVGLSSSSLF